MSRKPVPKNTEKDVLVKSGRRCCLCFWLENINEVQRGQIAHLDHDANNNKIDNLCFLCTKKHHDDYDSPRSQSKGLQIKEVKHHRDELYRVMKLKFRKTERNIETANQKTLETNGNSILKEVKTQQKLNPFDNLVRECKNSDTTHKKLTRKPEIFIWIWVYYLNKLRIERNTRDTVNLFNIIGPYIHTPGNGNGNVGIEEVLYTIRCLENNGYISLKKSDHGHNSFYDNNNIIFNTKYNELINRITFHQNGNDVSISWQ